MLLVRCPRCRSGPVFRGLVDMYEKCPRCSYRFEREPGYFTGAMYVSYALAVPTYAGLCLLVHLLRPGWSELAVFGGAAVVFSALAPVLFRYSRVLWMNIARFFDRGF
jgi:uncharacterized protein (DUF983 family)